MSRKKELFNTNNAPSAVGAYSQAVKFGDIMFISGQLPIDPQRGEVVEGLESQTRQVLENLKTIVEDAGSSLENVLKVTIYMKDISRFDVVNSIYSEYFNQSMPSRACIGVAGIPKGAEIEVEAILAL